MANSLVDLPFFLALLSLLGLSLYTLVVCKEDHVVHSRTSPKFFFAGVSFRQSLLSQIGTLFSLTYFAGGLVIYGRLYRAWYVIALLLSLAIALYLLRRVLGAIADTLKDDISMNSNPILAYYHRSLEPGPLRALLFVYALIYSGLLVEELAVARGVLNAIFPDSPTTTVMLMLVLSGIILIYISYGGFRAVLISDYHQSLVFAVFALALVYLMYSSPPSGGSLVDFKLTVTESPRVAGGIISTVIFFLGWLVAPLDVFARLNYEPLKVSDWAKDRYKLIVLAFLLLAPLMIAGVAFGAHLASVIPGDLPPGQLTSAITGYLVRGNSPLIAIAFLGAIFCMVFTTVDTFLMVLLQLGRQRSSPRLLTMPWLVPLFSLLLIASTQIDLDSAPVVGVFLASLLLIPLVVLWGIVRGGAGRFFAKSRFGILLALWASVAVFGFSFSCVRLDYDKHYLVPGFVVVGLVAGSLGARLEKRFRRISS